MTHPWQPFSLSTLNEGERDSNIDYMFQNTGELNVGPVQCKVVNAENPFQTITVTITTGATTKLESGSHLVSATTSAYLKAGATVEEIFVPHVTGWAGEDVEDIYSEDSFAACDL